jgi:choline dehydrogenase-like flavoprotein
MDLQAQYDAIVVGAGATGGIAAKELTERGLKVLLLEAGPAHDEALFHQPPLKRQVNSLDRIKAALKGQHRQARCSWFSPDKSHLFINDQQNPYTTSDEDFLWIRGRQVGGRFLSWGRVAVRMSDYDFKAASRDGQGEDWPICYDDLAPYYSKVETFLGVVGESGGIPNLPDGDFIAKAGLSKPEQQLKQATKLLWPHAHITPWRYVSTTATPADEQGKKRITSPIAAALKTGNLTLRPDSIVERIETDPVTGLATAVTFIDRVTMAKQKVCANIVMLCASTIETLRLMLNSKSEKHPQGLGNSSGLLGHYFMDQTNCVVFGTVPDKTGFELVDGKHPGDNHGGFYIPRFQNIGADKRSNYARGFNIQGMVGRIPVPDNVPMLFGMTAQGEMLPNKNNQISLHRTKKDAWGIPVPNIKIGLTENERNMAQAQMDTIQTIVKNLGWNIEIAASLLDLYDADKLMPSANWFERTMFKLSYKKGLALGSAIHECGGARMGNDPKSSVLNAHNQCWDSPNVFVTDSSCFVTNGTCGPTLTTMALTARAADYIATHYQGSGVLPLSD